MSASSDPSASDPAQDHAPDLAAIEGLALTALADLPPPFAGPAAEIAIRVEDFATPEVLADLGIEDPFDLTGLYDGVPLTEKSISEQVTQPDTIWLFRRPILEEWIERGDVTLADLVTHVLVHEVAHHFGWSDDDIARIDRWWE